MVAQCLSICEYVPKTKATSLIFILYNADLFVLSINLFKILLIAFYFYFAMHTQYIAVVALMRLAYANRSRPVTLAYLRQLDGINCSKTQLK